MKSIFFALCFALVAMGSPLPAAAQQTSSREQGIDLGFGGGKSGIGKGYVASFEYHLSSRLGVYPVLQYSWTGEVSGLGGGEKEASKVSASQYSYALGTDVAVWRSRRWEGDVSAENGFQKTVFRYTAKVSGVTFSGMEKRSGYYFLPQAKIKYWFTPRSNLSVTFGMVAYGDPTGGDGLGRMVFLAKYSHRFDPGKIARLFR